MGKRLKSNDTLRVLERQRRKLLEHMFKGQTHPQFMDAYLDTKSNVPLKIEPASIFNKQSYYEVHVIEYFASIPYCRSGKYEIINNYILN